MAWLWQKSALMVHAIFELILIAFFNKNVLSTFYKAGNVFGAQIWMTGNKWNEHESCQTLWNPELTSPYSVLLWGVILNLHSSFFSKPPPMTWTWGGWALRWTEMGDWSISSLQLRVQNLEIDTRLCIRKGSESLRWEVRAEMRTWGPGAPGRGQWVCTEHRDTNH